MSSRNFCGVIGESSVSELSEMISKLNFNNLYKHQVQDFEEGVFVGMNGIATDENTENKIGSLSEKFKVICFAVFANKLELISKLRCSPLISNDELIIKAYDKWGKECVKYLQGSWAFVLWDVNKKEAVLARNPTSDGTLFYYHKEDKLYFSSLVTSLLGVKGFDAKINKLKFFSECMKFSGIDNHTLYQNIFALPPAHVMVFKQNKLYIEQYWDLGNIKPIRFKNEKDYADGLYSLYHQIIAETFTANSNYAGTLSAGYDSMITTLLASNFMEKQNKKFSVVTFHANEIEDRGKIKANSELEAVSNFVNQHQNLDWHLTKDSYSLFDFLDSYTNHFGMPPFTANLWYIDSVAEGVRSLGYKEAIIAQGGNDALSYEGVLPSSNLQQLMSDIKTGYNLSPTKFPKQVIEASLKSISKERYKLLPKLRKERIKNTITNNTILHADFLHEIDAVNYMDYFINTQNEKCSIHKK